MKIKNIFFTAALIYCSVVSAQKIEIKISRHRNRHRDRKYTHFSGIARATPDILCPSPRQGITAVIITSTYCLWFFDLLSISYPFWFVNTLNTNLHFVNICDSRQAPAHTGQAGGERHGIRNAKAFLYEFQKPRFLKHRRKGGATLVRTFRTPLIGLRWKLRQPSPAGKGNRLRWMRRQIFHNEYTRFIEEEMNFIKSPPKEISVK